MALVDKLQKVSDRLAGLPVKFGDPRYVDLKAIHNGQPAVRLLPVPMIIPVPGYLAQRYMASGVEISTDDVLATGISRSYSLDYLKKSRYILGDSQKAELIDVITTELMSYSLLLRKLRGK